MTMTTPNDAKLDRIVAEARRRPFAQRVSSAGFSADVVQLRCQAKEMRE
jgi:hypothetical protein